MKTKKCGSCKQIKTLDNFHRDKHSKADGHRYKCKDCTKIYNIEYDKKNSQKKIKYNREYRSKNIEKLCENERKWYRENKEHVLEVKKLYRREKRKKDPLFRARNAISRRIRGILKGSKSKKSMEILGCDLNFFKTHIESLFKPGMNWDNYGVYGWHVDHIVPLSSGKTIEEIEKLCHYTNLQPLWALDNIRKSDNIHTNL